MSSIHSIIITDLLEATLVCEYGSSLSLQGVVGGLNRTSSMLLLSSIHSIIITDLLEATLVCEDGSSVSLQGVVGGNAIENLLKTGLREKYR